MVKKIIVSLSVILIIAIAVILYFHLNGTDPAPNPNIKSFGTVFDAMTSPDNPLKVDEPDFIYVKATNGKYGYVKKEEMYACGPSSPDDENWKERIFGSRDYYEIDVYDRDGITVIGKFRIEK
ncbi:MAG: hypothetical protein IKJ41_11145 [Clostridia bacterium]|nr:hypothetical protein [Clostridia bacterium]